MIRKTHQFFSAGIKILGADTMGKVWGKGSRMVYLYGADPDFCDQSSRDPIRTLQITMERLQEVSREDVVQQTLSVLCDPLGYEVQPKMASVRSDKKSATLEIMDVTVALGEVTRRLQSALVLDFPDEEREELCLLSDQLIRQAMELRDAIGRGEK